MYGIFNFKFGNTRCCLFHTQGGVWHLQRWVQDPINSRWFDVGRVSPTLGLRLYRFAKNN